MERQRQRIGCDTRCVPQRMLTSPERLLERVRQAVVFDDADGISGKRASKRSAFPPSENACRRFGFGVEQYCRGALGNRRRGADGLDGARQCRRLRRREQRTRDHGQRAVETRVHLRVVGVHRCGEVGVDGRDEDAVAIDCRRQLLGCVDVVGDAGSENVDGSVGVDEPQSDCACGHGGRCSAVPVAAHAEQHVFPGGHCRLA